MIGRTSQPGSTQEIAVDAATFVIWTFIVSVYVYKTWYLAAALALAVVLLLSATGRLRTGGLLPALVPVLVYFAVLLAGALWAEFPDETIRWVAIDSICIAVFVLFFIAGRNAPPATIMTALSTICIPSVAIAALNYALTPWATRSAQYAVEVLPFITPFLCLRAATARARWPSLVALAATFAVLVVARSRTPLGTASLLTALSVIAFRKDARSALRDAIVYGTVIVAILGALLFVPASRKLVAGMFVRLTHVGVDWGELHIPPEPVNQERVDLTRISMDMLPHSLPAGIGYMNFTLYFEDVTGYRLPLHNMYMTWLLEGGVACVLVVLVIATRHVRSLRAYIRRGTAEQRDFGRACMLASFGLLPLGAFHQVHQMPALWMLLGLGAACGAEARQPHGTAETDGPGFVASCWLLVRGAVPRKRTTNQQPATSNNLLIPQLLDSWRRADPPFAPALCEPLIAACARHLLQAERGSTVVDVGCGTGSMLAAFSAVGFRPVGVDANPAVAGARPTHVRLLLGDGERLPLRTGSVDALFAFSAFQYMDRDRALAECSRVLKPGGRFAVVENLAGNPFAKLERAKRRIRRREYPPYFAPRHHLRWQERAIYERHFAEVAFEAHHVISPLFLRFRALAVPEPPASRWNRSVLAALRLLQRLERRVLSAGVFRGAAWHLVVVGRK